MFDMVSKKESEVSSKKSTPEKKHSAFGALKEIMNEKKKQK